MHVTYLLTCLHHEKANQDMLHTHYSSGCRPRRTRYNYTAPSSSCWNSWFSEPTYSHTKLITRDHCFMRQIFPNSTGQFAKFCCSLRQIFHIKVKGLDIYIPPLTGKPEQQRFATRSGVLTGNDTSGAAQVATAHCLNERTLDPAVCS